ncbi:hypothetical protein SLA2020_180510 [Shorea laevis]
MAQNSEKRFHSIMDKLFHAPNSTPTSSRGKKRPNPSSSALALVEPRTRVDVFEGSQHPSASAGSSQAPMCRPWDRGDLMRRLATFKSMTWFAKPKVVSAVNCARRGWVNVDMDIIACESCGARLFFSTPPSWSQERVEKAALVFSLKLDNGHKLLCPWIDNACDERLAEFPPITPEDLVDKLKERSSALIQLLALPVISSSAFEYMRSSQLEEFLRQPLMLEYNNGNTESFQSEANGIGPPGVDPTNLYYQALKLVSLCGWEPRSLPYVVDCKDEANQSVKDADILKSSQGVCKGQNPSPCFNSAGSNETVEENVNSDACRLQNDPNSVVLDCWLCGASVGLWAFKAVPWPVELFRLVGYVEINPRNSGPGHEHDVDNGSIVKTGSNIGSSSKEQFSNLKLTIAGGPPPTKQNFKAMISFPVIGRNLRARFSLDSEFRDWINSCGEETPSEPKSNSSLGGKDSCTAGQAVPSEDSGTLERNRDDEGLYDSRNNDQPPCLDQVVSERCDTLGNHQDMTSEGMAVIASPDYSNCNSIMEDRTENIQNVAQVTDKNDSLPGNAEDEQTSQMGKACGEEVSLAKHPDSSSVASYMENNASADVTHNMDTRKEISGYTLQKDNNQEGNIVGDQSAENNRVMAYSAGKELRQPSLDKNMEFDPIRQHRHFCPWIVSIGSRAPGWKQTLSALLRQKDVSHSSPTSSPSSSSLIKVDDPIESVRKLFTSPVAKKLKVTRQSN